MATTYETSSTAKSGGRDYDMSLWYDSRWYKFGLITMLAVAIFWVWYQRTFAYSHGMDSMEPEFEKVWMGLWRVHMIVMPIFALVTWGWIWKTRDTQAQLDNLDPKLEIKRYFYWMMWLGVYLFGVYWGGSFFTEQDASWHQVIIRDTSFTPSHVVVFYGSFPMYIVCGVASYLYAMTRLPLYSRGTSFPLVMAIAGPLMILPNVGLNEWGHAFWFMEELFSAPLHWGFVILGWAGLFSGGIAAQIITRYSNLTDVVWNGQSKVILNNRIVP
ncbi:MAG TPA: methane monooxygenase/ammonia monooxygenase subunit C [Nitrosospira sp.]